MEKQTIIVDLAIDGSTEDVKRLRDLLKAEGEGRLMILPCKPGTTVYRVIDKCKPRIEDCPWSGGRGTNRCPEAGGDDSRCGAYIEETKFTVCVMKIGQKTFVSREEAERERRRLNER